MSSSLNEQLAAVRPVVAQAQPQNQNPGQPQPDFPMDGATSANVKVLEVEIEDTDANLGTDEELEADDEGAVLEFQPFAGLVTQSITLIAESGPAYVPGDVEQNLDLNFSNPFSKKGGALRSALDSLMEPLATIASRDVLLIADNIHTASPALEGLFENLLRKVLTYLRQDDDAADMPLIGAVTASRTFTEGHPTLHIDTQIQSLYSDLNSRTAIKQFDNLNVFLRNVQKNLGALTLNLVFKFRIDDLLNPDTFNAVTELRNMKSVAEFMTFTRSTLNEMIEAGFESELVHSLFMDEADCVVVAASIHGKTQEVAEDDGE